MRINLFVSVLALLCSLSCREIAEFYTRGYKFQYARPIGLMMSPAFDSLGLSGKGIKIGVIDAGFGKLKRDSFTMGLQVAQYRDFVDGDTAFFFSNNESTHGTSVTKSIGGKLHSKVHGLAFNATYYLAKTDIEDQEPRADEERLLEAIRWLVSEGVDVINISLGYTVFDDDNSYNPAMLGNKKSRCSAFIDSLLAVQPDLIVVVSAGNEGQKPWQYITFPADVQEVISVGSTDFDGMEWYHTSGLGAPDMAFIKPDLATYPTPPGNSHTAPVVTGLCAAILEYKRLDRPTLTKMLKASASKAGQPDRYLGWGVPGTAWVRDLR